MIRRLLVFAGSMVFAAMITSGIANGQMVSNSAIQNDPAKEELCVKRAKIKPVQFIIDQSYVNSIRAAHPDTTFIADDGTIPQLIECRANERTGVYEADALSSEDSPYWHLVRPSPSCRATIRRAGRYRQTMRVSRLLARRSIKRNSIIASVTRQT